MYMYFHNLVPQDHLQVLHSELGLENSWCNQRFHEQPK